MQVYWCFEKQRPCQTLSHTYLVLLLETYSELSLRPKQSRRISIFSFQYIRRPVAGYGTDYSDGYGYKQW